MFAIIKTGGKQYKVKKGDVLKVDLLDKNVGDSFDFNETLLVSENEKLSFSGCVKAFLLKHVRNDKIIIFKKKRRKNYHRTKGHRQHMSLVRIEEIGV